MPKKEGIIHQSLELIDEVGLENISMRKIAVQCDMPLSSLYSHYKSKAELLNTIFEYSLDKSFIAIDIKEIKEKITPKTYLTNRITTVNENKLYYRFIRQYYKSEFLSNETKADNKKCFMKQQLEINEILKPYLREDIDMKMLGFMMHGIISEVVRRDDVTSETINSLVDIMLNGIMKERKC